MNFGRRALREEPEINLIPLIDVLLVILIFLMVTTTYSRFSQLEINLPTADGQASSQQNTVNITVGVNGKYVINQKAVAFGSPESFSDALREAANGNADPVIVIDADANATHQSVVNVMEAARIAGYSRIAFTTQSNTK